MPEVANPLKNTITNVCAVIVLAAGALKVALDAQQGASIDWFAAIGAVVVAIVSWWTGKK